MNMKDMSSASKLVGGFGFILLLLVAISTICLTSSNTTLHNIDKVVFANNLKSTMLELEADHLSFLIKSQKFFADPSIKNMDVQTDDHKCRLGKWLYGDDRRQTEETLPELASVFKRLEAPHAVLHGSINEINTILTQQSREDAFDQVMSIFITKTESALEEVQEILGEITTTLDTYAEHSNEELRTTASSMKMKVVVLSICAVLIGAAVSLVLIRFITGSIKSIVKTTERLAPEI